MVFVLWRSTILDRGALGSGCRDITAGPDQIKDIMKKKKKNNKNPRYSNGHLRRKYRARLKAIGAPCAICGKPIHYDEPSNSDHPLSFVIDEIIPVSRYKEFGYLSREQAASDWSNLQACHYICNARKSNRTMTELKAIAMKGVCVVDGIW